MANSGAGGSNYTGFRFYGGQLFPIPGSTASLAANAAPGDVLFNGTGTKLAGTEVGPSRIDSFTVGFDGRLTPAPGSPFKAQGLGPFGSEFRPTDPNQLFVSNAHNTAADSGTISAFTDSRNGTLTPVAGSPFADDQMAPCWVEITRDGRFLFTVNIASGTISRFRIARDGTLTLLGSTPVAATGAVGAVDARLSPDGRFLYVDESKTGSVGIFTVGLDGRLTAAPGSPFPAQGLGPFGSEFRPTNPNQLFVSNAHNTAPDSGTVSAFKDHRDGRLSPVNGSPFADDQMAPCWVEITHDGQFLFTVNTASGSVSSYQIAPDGALTLLGSTPISGTKVGAVDARLSPDGGFLYVDESATGKVAAFAVSGGSLTELGTSPFPLPAGAAPAGIVVSQFS